MHAIISGALTQGVRWKWIAANPAKAASPPRDQRLSGDPHSPGDIWRLIRTAAADRPAMAALIATAALSGCRRGELCALRWEDLDGSTLHVERSVKVVKGGEEIGPPKGGKPRLVAVSDLALSTLEEYRGNQAEMAAYCGSSKVR